ncbi:Glycosyltransferase 61 [Dillenia turbinata]|uniref:Glycosyltransferase 61 n=1 Tax=Dillenia turbinata TaxID=194707 RepID=A0AAN8UPJ9_9MAGN
MVKEVIDQQRMLDCTKTHTKPAVLFSEGGYAGNFFHSSADDFRKFLRSSFPLERSSGIELRDGGRKGPGLVIISRKRTQRFTNENEIAKMAKDLGCEVVMLEANSNITSFSRIVNSCDVMMGVHGAGLTNMVFLPEKAVFIQMIAIGHE